MKTCVFEDKERFSIYPLTIDCDRPQEPIYHTRGIGFHQLFIVTGGSGFLESGGNHFDLKTGDCFFLKSTCPHAYRGDADFRTTFLGFDGSLCTAIFEYYNIGDYCLFESNGKAERLIRRFFENFDTTRESPLLSAQTHLIVSTYFSEGTKAETTPLERVKNLLESHFAEPLNMDDILAVYPFSKAKLSRDFRSAYGESVFNMLLAIRLKHAHELLLNAPSMKLKEIAACCGFQDVSYFCKMYKRVYQKSPRGTSQ